MNTFYFLRRYNVLSEKYGRIEVKSARLPLKTITYNQCHPYECEYFLFVNYDTENGGEEIFFVPSKDIINEQLFSKSKHHPAGLLGKISLLQKRYRFCENPAPAFRYSKKV